MADTPQTIRDRIITAMLPNVGRQGWTWEDTVRAAHTAGYQDTMPQAVFPGGLNDVVAHFSDLADRNMLKKLEALPPEARVRDKIRAAVLSRYEGLADHSEAVRASLAYWSAPMRILHGQRVLWRSAGRIWDWAGDTATDYNRQTKRALLCSILLGSSMVWIDDKSEDYKITKQFIDRRIENVMEIGKVLGTIKHVPNKKQQTR